MLSRVCSSAYLQHVIATNPVIASYIVERRFCDPDRVQMIREGVLDLPSIGEPKRRFPDHKGTFDVCFAAYKQMPFGLDKGYDIFVEVAKRLARVSGDFTFHVVGTFGPEDIDVSELGSRIHFYGPQLDDFWAHYYRDKDMILSPNRPFVLAPGAFDGIPTGSVLLAGACGVTMFCSDQLGLTRGLFQDGRDIVLIDTDVERIVERVIDYYESPAKLYETGERGASRVREICSYECGMRPRIDLLRAVANQSGT